MNIELLESFGQNYPEEFDGSLDCVSLAVTCAFNRRGTLLAVGCNDGRIAIWDFLTRGIAKIITSHVHPVCSLSFSRRGRTLVSASTDNTVCVIDVLSSDIIAKWRFSTPVLKVQFNPRNENLILVCPLKHAAVIIHLPNSGATASAAVKKSKEGDAKEEDSSEDSSDSKGQPKTHTILPLDEDSDLNITASYDRRGEFVYTGNAKGRIAVINVGSGSIDGPEIVASFRVANTAIKQIEFAPKRKDIFLVNTADRIIRVYDSQEVLTCGVNGEPEPVQKIQDLVNKTTWKKCCFSGGPDAEFICAGSARQHSIYVYERLNGTLVKILNGLKGETLLDVVWHPLRPIICSIASGVVSVWAQAQVENWSAFAPDFKEMDENVEYEERESEFDIDDEDRSPGRLEEDKKRRGDEDSAVDVTTVYPTSYYISSDEDEDVERQDLIYLPVTLEIDEPESTMEPIVVVPPQLTDCPAVSSKGADIKQIDINLETPKEDIPPVPVAGTIGKPARTAERSNSSNGRSGRPGGKRAETIPSSSGGGPVKRKKSNRPSSQSHAYEDL